MILLASLIYYFRSPRPAAYGWSVPRRHQESSALVMPKGLTLINILMATMLLSALAYYVIASNNIIAREYSIKNLDDRLSGLQEVNSRLTAEQIMADNHASIVNFASSNDMIPVGESVRIVAGSEKVALMGR